MVDLLIYKKETCGEILFPAVTTENFMIELLIDLLQIVYGKYFASIWSSSKSITFIFLLKNLFFLIYKLQFNIIYINCKLMYLNLCINLSKFFGIKSFLK